MFGAGKRASEGLAKVPGSLALADLEGLHVSEDKIQDLEKAKHHAEPRQGHVKF
jgi:hypothetical protein